MSFSNKRSILLLVLLLAGLSILLYKSTILLFPGFVHAWTQSDRYAIALQFLENGFDLFHPATYNLQTIDGITRVDFPINEYIVALLMKLLGTSSPAIFRIYTLCMSLIGLCFLYLLSEKITGSRIKAFMAVLFVFFAPVYAYYQAGFIPSIPAISCVFAGYWFFFSYKENEKKRHLYAGIFFLLLAALMRSPFLVFLLAVILQQGCISLQARRFRQHEIIGFLLSLLIFAGYYLYNVHLGRIYGTIFLTYLMPARSMDEFMEILSEMWRHWKFHYFTLWHYLLLLLTIVFLLWAYVKKRIQEEEKKYLFQLLIISCGSILFFLAMSRQFYAHDYYFLDSLFIPVVILLLIALRHLQMKSSAQRICSTLAFLVIGVMMFRDSSAIQSERYETGSWDRVEASRKNFTGMDGFLDDHGIPATAKILVLDAQTSNIPLMLMNRKGYTVVRPSAESISMALFWCNWDYVAIQDESLVSEVIRNYPLITRLLDKVAGNGKVSLYKWSREKKSKSLEEFLSIAPADIIQHVKESCDSMAGGLCKIGKEQEFINTISLPASGLKERDLLKALVKIRAPGEMNAAELQLVASVASPERTAYYKTYRLSDYYGGKGRGKIHEFLLIFPEIMEGDELKIYLFNPGREELLYDDWEVIVYR